MIVFVNAAGEITGYNPSRINQGSIDANKITLVGPFPNSVVTLAFTLPNGQVIGPQLAEPPAIAEDFTMTDNGNVYGNLYMYSYTVNRSLTALSGTLGIQFFITVYDGTNDDATASYTISSEKINVPIYNGSKYLPDGGETPSNWDEAIKYLAALNSLIANAIKADPPEGTDGNPIEQTIDGDLGLHNITADGIVYTDTIKPKTPNAAVKVDSNYATVAGATFQHTNIGTVFTTEILKVLTSLIVSDICSVDTIKFGNVDNSTELFDLIIDTVNHLITVRDLTANNITTAKLYADTITPKTKNAWIDVAGVTMKDGAIKATTFSSPSAHLYEVYPRSGSGNTIKITDVQGGVNLNLRGNLNITKYPNSISPTGNLNVEGNLDVEGNLNVKGSTVTQHQESLVIRDNIVIVNSSGAAFSTSGLVINVPANGDAPGYAYGLLYDPIDETVKIGKGTVATILADDGSVSYEFTYDVGEDLPLAARSGFNDASDGSIAVWNKDLNAFTPADVIRLLRAKAIDIGSDNDLGEGHSNIVLGIANTIGLDKEGKAVSEVILRGFNLHSNSNQQIVDGKNNYISSDLMYMFGNGRTTFSRSNAFATDYSGNFFISNEAYVYQRDRGEDGGATGRGGHKRLLRENERVWHDDYRSDWMMVEGQFYLDIFDGNMYVLGGTAVCGTATPLQKYIKCYSEYAIQLESYTTVDNVSFNKLDNLEVLITHGGVVKEVFADAFMDDSITATRIKITDFYHWATPSMTVRYYY